MFGQRNGWERLQKHGKKVERLKVLRRLDGIALSIQVVILALNASEGTA